MHPVYAMYVIIVEYFFVREHRTTVRELKKGTVCS